MSEIKVNKISPRTNCGTTTLGDSGDTFTIPAGVSITNNGTASGFGATGAASWNTTVKTGDFTAVAGEGYFVNTTSGAINVTLPAGTAGAVVAIKDYAGTFDTNNVTLTRNGSDKIGGQAINGTLSTEGIAVTLVFVDSTQGWLVTDDGLQTSAPTASYIAATGGTIATTPCGDFKTHTFTGPGTFTVCSVGNSEGSNTIEYLVVAGGGGAAGGQPGTVGTGGGGAGGVRFASSSIAPLTYPAKPLAGPANLPVTATGYPVTVGGGGAGSPNANSTTRGTVGVNSVFAGTTTITSAGGGGGGADNTNNSGGSGGSGGGGSNSAAGGSGNTPPVSPAQGTNGGTGVGTATPGWGGGGGGGFTQAGQAAQGSNGGYGGDGGGFPTAFGSNGVPCGSYRYYGGGGGAGAGYNGQSNPGGAGGKGGGGAGKSGSAGPTTGNAGTANTGGGGGGVATNSTGGTGGSGIVVIRYKFQN
jgi:hypothetical protein